MDTLIVHGSDRPSAVREWLLIMAMFAVAWLPLVCLALAFLAVAFVWHLPQAILPPLMWVMMGVLRRYGDREALPGRAVQPGEEPELAAVVRAVAEQVGFREHLLVRITPDPEAAMGRAKVSGARSYVLLLGLPLLRSLTVGQLAAVIGHELAHRQHINNRRASWLLDARCALAQRLEGQGRFRPLTPLARPLLRASQQRVWQAELAADADAARVAGSDNTTEALELLHASVATFDGIGERWLAELAEEHTYPEDFYDAFDAVLRDPFVRRRSAGVVAEQEALDPYHAAGHPPLGQRVAALPPAEGSRSWENEPLTLHAAAAIEQWCVRQLAGLDGPGGHGGTKDKVPRGTKRPPRRGHRYEPPEPVRLLDRDMGQLHVRLDGGDELALLTATRCETPVQALSAALEAVRDGRWPRLARRLEPALRWVPAAERPPAARDVLVAAMGTALVALLRGAGWDYASPWMSTVFTAQDGRVLDVHELLAVAVDSSDPEPVRALLETIGTQEVLL
ncbi:Zn-dependent protease with chaperone function [Streptomyces achromogenes]|uniref:M48 family metalloprotease n=1 Tax=Streptomyces achromogenes TaxID=67255 RepID=UPI0027887AD6|nr:M48 family metalloprotease [Streptomyces achromogenes]MDQ0831418.1 Zn-dependent protease with chaperone function [Streptomyces achromogenes]